MVKRKILGIALLGMIISLAVGVNTRAQQAGESKSGKSMAMLIKEIKETKDPKIKARILHELETKKPETSEDIDATINALDDEDMEIQDVAVRNVQTYKVEKAIPKLLEKIKGIPPTKIEIDKVSPAQEKDYRIKSMSALALSEMKVKEALPIIIDKLGDAPFPSVYDERILGISATNYGKNALPVIKKKIKEIERKNPYGKMRLLAVIMNMQDRNAIPELKDMFDNDDPDIKSAAAKGLRNLGEKIDISKIIKTLKKHEEHPKRGKEWGETQSRLIDEIGFSGNPDAIPFLKERIERERKKHQQYPSIYSEIVALARIGGHENYSYLLNIYKESKYYEVKSSIISAFGTGKMEEAIPFLTEMLNDKSIDKELRLRCAESLRQITGEEEKYRKISWEIMEGQR